MVRRVTITMPDETFAAVQRDVASGAAPNVSAYLSGLADEKTGESTLLAVLDELDARLGAPGDEDVQWARAVLDAAR